MGWLPKIRVDRFEIAGSQCVSIGLLVGSQLFTVMLSWGPVE